MNDCILPVGVSALACAIAGEIEDSDDLALLSALFVQLGDTLATIAAQRATKNKEDKEREIRHK